MEAPLSRTFQALADPTRRAILKMLGERDMTAGDIAAQFAISAPSVSHHLNVLKQAGLIQSQRNGQTLVYSLNTTVVQEFVQEVMQFFNIGEDDHA